MSPARIPLGWTRAGKKEKGETQNHLQKDSWNWTNCDGFVLGWGIGKCERQGSVEKRDIVAASCPTGGNKRCDDDDYNGVPTYSNV